MQDMRNCPKCSSGNLIYQKPVMGEFKDYLKCEDCGCWFRSDCFNNISIVSDLERKEIESILEELCKRNHGLFYLTFIN